MKEKNVKIQYEVPIVEIRRMDVQIITASNGLNDCGGDGIENSDRWDDLV